MRRIRGSKLAKAMMFGAIGTFLGIAASAALDYARQDWTNPIGIAAVAVLAGVSGVIPLLQADKPDPPPPAPGYPQGYPPGYPPAHAPGYPPNQPSGHPYPPGPMAPASTRRGKRIPLAVAALMLLTACGGGAAAVTYGVQFLGGWITGDQDGQNVLSQPASASAGDLTITVTGVKVTRNFTRVQITAANTGTDVLTLPVFGYTHLTGGRRTLEGDAFRSDWPDDIPPGSEISGTLVFPGHLPAGTGSANLSFTQIFGKLGGPRSITVSGLELAAR